MGEKRIVAYVADIIVLTNKSERQCERIMKKIRKHYNKLPNEVVSIKELAKYFGLTNAEVRKTLGLSEE